MACTRLLGRSTARLQSLGIRHQWIIVKNNSGDEIQADITLPDKQSNTQCMWRELSVWCHWCGTVDAPLTGGKIQPGKKNSWPLPIGKYKVWLTEPGGMGCHPHASAWFLVNKTNDNDTIIDVGDHIHYHIENGSEEKMPIEAYM